jgi:hypothetical protein
MFLNQYYQRTNMCILCGGACGGIGGTIAPILGVGGAILWTKLTMPKNARVVHKKSS